MWPGARRAIPGSVPRSRTNSSHICGRTGTDPIKFVTNVQTAVGSHGVAYDETNNIVYTQDQLPNEGALFSFTPPK